MEDVENHAFLPCLSKPAASKEDNGVNVDCGLVGGLVDGREGFWAEEAHRRGIRLPRRDALFTNGAMEHWLRRLGIEMSIYYEWSGTKVLQEFRDMNEGWTLQQWVGLLLEWQWIEERGEEP